MNPFVNSKRSRNLLGGYDALSSAMPFLDLFLFFLHWFTVPIEAFLRKNFGERYFSQMNFLAGFIVLGFWTIVIGGIAAIFHDSSPTGTGKILNQLGAAMFASLNGFSISMFLVWLLYIGFSIYHFLHIWWRNRTGESLHTLDPGTSRLEPLGGWLMRWVNVPLSAMIRMASQALPAHQREKLDIILPVLDDRRAFTERFVEPFVVYGLGMFLFANGFGVLGLWVMFSGMALATYTNFRYDAERHSLLDMRDQILESTHMSAAMQGESGRMRVKQSTQRTIEEIAKEVKNKPEVMQTIQQEQPTVAAAMAALSDKLKNFGEQENITTS